MQWSIFRAVQDTSADVITVPSQETEKPKPKPRAVGKCRKSTAKQDKRYTFKHYFCFAFCYPRSSSTESITSFVSHISHNVSLDDMPTDTNVRQHAYCVYHHLPDNPLMKFLVGLHLVKCLLREDPGDMGRAVSSVLQSSKVMVHELQKENKLANLLQLIVRIC